MNIQVGGDRIGKRYWIKDNKRIYENPNGYQKSTLSESTSNSDSDKYSDDTSSDTDSDDTSSYSDTDSEATSYSNTSSDTDSYYDTISDSKPELVLKNRIPYKRDPINYRILNNAKILHTCNDRNCQSYKQVIPNETIYQHMQRHIERENRHNRQDFSPIPLTKTKTKR
jgi:hypothetical protein